MQSSDKSPRRWSNISKDPNAVDVLAARQRRLESARRRSLIEDRRRYVEELAKGKDVLDVGVVEHTSAAWKSSEWLHGRIAAVAKTCVGTDVLAATVAAALRDHGYKIIEHDITLSPLPQTFDLIVCGEILEHLDHPGALFRNARKMLRPNGELIITTPNPWYVNALWKNLCEGPPFTDSADHVAWYDASTLCELGERHGLVLKQYVGVSSVGRTFKARLFFGARRSLIRLGVRPELFAKSIIYQFALDS